MRRFFGDSLFGILLGLLAVGLMTCFSQPAFSQDDNADVADVPCQDCFVGSDFDKHYLLIGPYRPMHLTSHHGYKLLLVLPGGEGNEDFQWFVRRISKFAASDYLVAELVAPVWSPDQAQNFVWPTAADNIPVAKFSTEAFIAGVVSDIKRQYPIDSRYIFALGWSSGGPPVYAAWLQPKSPLTGAFVAMSVFHPEGLTLGNAKGRSLYILHGLNDSVVPLHFAEAARDTLTQQGAHVDFVTYPGDHGWGGFDVYGTISQGLSWLEQHAASPSQ